MKTVRLPFCQIMWSLLAMLALISCASAQVSSDPQVDAINTIRTRLDLPDLPLEFVEATTMINSPSGDLKVALYQDGEGRKYLVDVESNQVVEIDARAVLAGLSPESSDPSSEELRVRAEKYLAETIPNWDTLQAELVYEEGEKGDNHFFTWYGPSLSGAMNRPFAQIGLHKSGELFAYYNTLLLQ